VSVLFLKRLYVVFALTAVPLWSAPKTTFYKDVLPVLQKNCQSCHRPGEAAPMPLVSYRDVQPFATAIKDAVLSRRMPPWQADTHFGKFSNDRTLASEDIKAIVAWVDKGAPEGDSRDSPEPRTFGASWHIGKPDVVFTSPKKIAGTAMGQVDVAYCIIPTGFTEDRWVEKAELLPADRMAVRDVVAFVREPGSAWLKEAKAAEVFAPKERALASIQGGGFGGDTVARYSPGLAPTELRPGQGKLIKAGSDIVLRMHFTGDNVTPILISLGFVFAPRPPVERVYTLAASRKDFVIPAGAATKEVESKLMLSREVRIVSLTPHMHLRGKSFTYRAAYPDGRVETLLSVPHYSFHWQVAYQEAGQLVLPPGTEIRCTAVFDNSDTNSNNPDANVEVRYGEQSSEEMMIGFMDVAFDAKLDPADLFKSPQ
jgi:hypothetical protein